MQNSYFSCNELAVLIFYYNAIHLVFYSLDSPQLSFEEVVFSLYISRCSFWSTNVTLSVFFHLILSSMATYAQATSPMPPRLMHDLTKKQSFELIANPVMYPTLCQILFWPNADSGQNENKNYVKAEEKTKAHCYVG